MDRKTKKILYVRSGPYQLDITKYNSQEIGLASAFSEIGYECDIMYYHKEKSYDQTIIVGGKSIKILWRKGIRLLRSGIYPQILKKDFLKQYDIIICSEYSQIMSVLLAKRHPNVYIYSGPYYNLFKIPFLNIIYDFLFKKTINGNVKKIYTKSILAQNYLERKGYRNIETIGVGLDTKKFENIECSKKTNDVLNMMGNNSILYVGAFSSRKNFPFILNVYSKIYRDNNNINLIMIGKGDKEYIHKHLDCIDDDIVKHIKIVDGIDNAQLKYIYPRALALLLPSKLEIFGMVLLEAMYLGAPVITSVNGGAVTLVDNNIDGIVIDGFDEEIWKEKILEIIDNEEARKNIIKEASRKINQSFLWKSIANKIIKNI